jgi:superfamily II DNA helicase RecQ
MKIRIFTIPFNETIQGFDDNIINNFCINKKVYKIDMVYFSINSKSYWSASIQYEEIIKPELSAKTTLNEIEQKLYNKLKEWRVIAAQKEGVPVFLVAKNIQLEQIVKNKSTSYESLRNIKGIGTAKITKYGKEIIEIVKNFYEQNK